MSSKGGAEFLGRIFRNAYVPFWTYFFVFLVCLFFPLPLYKGLAGADPDNYMRAAEILAFLRHGEWFNTVIDRFSPPGVDLYSRLVDLPYFLIAKPLTLFLPDRDAVFVSGFFVSLLLWIPAYIALSVWVVRPLVSPFWSRLAPLPALFASFSFLAFQPGIFDHHNAQILLLLVLVGCLTRLSDEAWWQKGRGGMVLALASAFSAAIGVETLPFVALIFGIVFVHAAADGQRARAPSFLVLALAFPFFTALLLVLTRAPATYFDAVLYRMSFLHVFGAALAGGVALGLYFFCRFFKTSNRTSRLAVLCCLSLAGAGCAVLYEPELFTKGPWIGVPEELRRLALFNTSELFPDARKGFALFLLYASLLPSCVGYLWAVRKEPARGWSLLPLLFLAVLVSALGFFYAGRVRRFSGYFYCPGLLLFVSLAFDWIKARKQMTPERKAYARLALALLLAPVGGPFLLTLYGNAPVLSVFIPFFVNEEERSCHTREVALYLGLPEISAKRKRVLVDGPSGPELVFRTDHEIISGAFYNTWGEYANRDFYHAKSNREIAEVLLRNRIDYIVFCSGDPVTVWPSSQDEDDAAGTAFVRAALLDGTAPFLDKIEMPLFGESFLYRVDEAQARRFAGAQK